MPSTASGSERSYQERVDRWLLVACLLLATLALGVAGLAVGVYALALERRGRAQGLALRPTALTIVGGMALVDSSINFLFWILDVLPTHDIFIVHRFIEYIGRSFDAAYYLGYNTTGGGGSAVASEKGWQIAGCLILFPMRMVASWGFLKLRAWGLHFLRIATWLYVFFITGYVATLMFQFNWRFVFTSWGLTGWWAINIVFFLPPFLILPYLYTVDDRYWH